MKKIQLIAGIVMTVVIALSAGVAPYEKKFDVDFSKARHTDWDYTSGGATVEADLAYWLNRLARWMPTIRISWTTRRPFA